MELESASIVYQDEDKTDNLTKREVRKVMNIIDKLVKYEIKSIDIHYKVE